MADSIQVFFENFGCSNKKKKLESNWDLGFGSEANSWFGFKGGGNKLFQLNKKNPSAEIMDLYSYMASLSLI